MGSKKIFLWFPVHFAINFFSFHSLHHTKGTVFILINAHISLNARTPDLKIKSNCCGGRHVRVLGETA